MSRIISTISILLVSNLIAANEIPRTITVSGQGAAQITPDRATVVLSIVARGEKVSDAQQEVGEVVARVQALADELDIPDSRIDTMSASVYPDYRFNPSRQDQEFRGYVSERQMRIVLHDLEKVGVFVERAIEQGVNQVTPPQLSSSRRSEAYRDALDNAVEEARMNADRLASALGVTVGPVMQVSAGSPASPSMPFMGARQGDVMMNAQAVAMPETYNAGDMTVTATVNVVYELSE